MTPTPPHEPDPHEPVWGEAPIPDVMAALLAERHPLGPGERFDVDVLDRGLGCALVAARHVVRIQIRYESGACSRDPWELLVDALDALVGQLVESDGDYRRLPIGQGVQFEGAFFSVDVEKDVPELRDLADRWLKR